jgi:hypothetical protein
MPRVTVCSSVKSSTGANASFDGTLRPRDSPTVAFVQVVWSQAGAVGDGAVQAVGEPRAAGRPIARELVEKRRSPHALAPCVGGGVNSPG